MSDITSVSSDNNQIATSLDEFHTGLKAYLDYCGLPSDDVLVCLEERVSAIEVLPRVLKKLPVGQRICAQYISKFAAACASGLFDAALSYLWDETIHNLRLKVSRFDLGYFFDTVINDGQRDKFSTEDDLEKIQDWDFVQGCSKTGIISKLGYMHLDYIRNMRNHASAAHPNQVELTGLQLVSWLETCIKEVLAKDPGGPAIEARRLLNSLRMEKLSSGDVPHISTALNSMPDDVLTSFLRSVFGLYSNDGTEVHVRANIALIAMDVWDACPDGGRYEIGLRAASFRVNGETSRAELGRSFLEKVKGLPYLPQDTLSVEISSALDELYRVHNAWDNFHNEPSPARNLKKYIPANGVVPPSVSERYVKVVTMCRIGNGYGVSEAAVTMYNAMIHGWQEDQVRNYVHLLEDNDVRSRLRFPSCATKYQKLAEFFAQRVTNHKLKEALAAIGNFPFNQMHNAANDTDIKRNLARV